MTGLRPPLRLFGPAALAIAAAVAAAGVVTRGYQDFSWWTGADGLPLIWKARQTTVYPGNDTLGTSLTFGKQFRAAAAGWGANPKADFRFFVHNGDHDAVVGDLDGFNDCFFADLGPTILGMAYVYSDASDTALWDCDVAFTSYPKYTFGPGYYDFQSVAVHELGHVLGLVHSRDQDAVMWPRPASVYGPKPAPRKDDLAGQQFLYPWPPGAAGPTDPGPGDLPPPLPVRTGTMTALSVSAEEVFVGEPLTFTATVTNANDGGLLLASAQTTPRSTGAMEEVLLGAGESLAFSLERTVTDLPGLYPIRLVLGGIDPTLVHVAQQTVPGSTVRVRRPTIPLPLQNDLFASLGPGGDERVDLFLAKGQQVSLDLAFSPGWAGGRAMRLLDPSGEPVESWKPGRTARARASGVHSLVIENAGDAKRTYSLATECPRRPPAIRGKGALDGSVPAEAAFSAWGRTTATIAVRGPRALAPRITALRAPSGATIDVPDGTEVVVEEFGEDGIWTAIVDGAPGAAGNFRVTGRPAWLEGMEVSR